MSNPNPVLRVSPEIERAIWACSQCSVGVHCRCIGRTKADDVGPGGSIVMGSRHGKFSLEWNEDGQRRSSADRGVKAHMILRREIKRRAHKADRRRVRMEVAA